MFIWLGKKKNTTGKEKEGTQIKEGQKKKDTEPREPLAGGPRAGAAAALDWIT